MGTPKHGRVERRLTAILAADVAGYSRLIGLDEEGTHARLQDHLRSLVDPKIAEHRGRVVKNTGDGLLAEFSSVVDAVRCAVDVQRGMAERNSDVPEDKRIEFRIGINVGDVMLDRGDIFGDGVNVADAFPISRMWCHSGERKTSLGWKRACEKPVYRSNHCRTAVIFIQIALAICAAKNSVDTRLAALHDDNSHMLSPLLLRSFPCNKCTSPDHQPHRTIPPLV